MNSIEKAITTLSPIKYIPFDTAYFVVMNGNDIGNSNYCIKCIADAVKEARRYHNEEREKIKVKYNLIETKGYCFHNGKKVKVVGKYTKEQISKSKRSELKKYPAKASFTYEGHDPDFGGGLHDPCTCDNCGEPFQCSFTPNLDEAQYLLRIVNQKEPLTDRDKWEIEIALYNYEYTDNDVKLILKQVSEKLLLILLST